MTTSAAPSQPTVMHAPPTQRPLSLQARLMTAVIGFVSLILVIVAVITSATLGETLERQLSDRMNDAVADTRLWISDSLFFDYNRTTASSVLSGKSVQPGLLLIVAVPNAEPTGVIIQPRNGIGERQDLTQRQLAEIDRAVTAQPHTTTTISDVGSYRLVLSTLQDGTVFVTGLPRGDIQRQMTELFTVIALATLGGLILLALTTAVTIRLSLRPLRAVAATATRVAAQPLDRGEVVITERVPADEADPRTETGLVGAALNRLLDHVDSSLAARQRNEDRMRQFVADASHELRTPLASIRGYSELSLRALAQGRTPEITESTTTALERIQAQSLRMTRLVEDLLLLARLDEGRELQHSSVDLAQLAVEAISDARPTGPEHTWELDLPDDPVLISGDYGRLHQVLGNLLANARTHTPAGTTITVRVDGTDTEAMIAVHDDGPGIEPAMLTGLFARFARGDVSRARQTGGTGLGLAIAKAIVEGHGGRIEVGSVPGSTTFTVRLPAASSAAAAPSV